MNEEAQALIGCTLDPAHFVWESKQMGKCILIQYSEEKEPQFLVMPTSTVQTRKDPCYLYVD